MDKSYEWQKFVTCNIFEKVTNDYYDKSFNQKNFKRTAQVDKVTSLIVVYKLLISCVKEYHRYNVCWDNVLWAKFVNETDQYIVWLDCNQNIQLTPKFEDQSAHYSGKQHTLHDEWIDGYGGFPSLSFIA